MDNPPARLSQKLAAEAVGTFALVFVGCGAAAVDSMTNTITHAGVCLAFGLVVLAMIYATGHICGAHFNPAVTVAFAVTGRLGWKLVVPYVSAQLAAAVAAAFLLNVALGSEAVGNSSTVPALSTGAALIVEITITAFLMFVIISVATDHRAVGSAAGLAIGATVTACALFGGPLTGGSMNPARSIAPALASGRGLDWTWLYIGGPMLGAAAAAIIYHFIASGPPYKQAHGA